MKDTPGTKVKRDIKKEKEMGRFKKMSSKEKSELSQKPAKINDECLFIEVEDPDNFNLTSQAEEKLMLGNEIKAEKLFLKAIEALRKQPEGLDYALGRYGEFLRKKARLREAEKILREAIDLNTDIPKIWEDYVGVLAGIQDLEGLFKYVDLMLSRILKDSGPGSPRIEWILNLACRQKKAEAIEFAEAVARRAMDEATQAGDKVGRWAAAGELGHILELTGRINEAEEIWSNTFNEGSNDPVTANRLSLYLKREKEWERAIKILKEALTRGLRANIEEQLRKRLVRCEGKLAPEAKRRDVPAFSVRYGQDTYQLLFQLRIRPPIQGFSISDSVAFCLGQTKGTSFFVDVDLDSGKEISRIENLSEMDDVIFNKSRWGLGVKRTASVGSGPTYIFFLNPNREEIKKTKVMDVTSDVIAFDELWYVGCRDGYLYTYDLHGNLCWKWETPGSQDYDGDPYFRPCPYVISPVENFVVIGNMSNIFAIDPDGNALWHTKLPNENENEGLGPFISFLVSNENGILAGPSQGRIYRIDKNGRIQEVRDLGGNSIIPYLLPDGSLAAAWCDETFFFFKGLEVVNTLDFPRPPIGMEFLGDDLVTWSGRHLSIMDSKGNKLWNVEFSKHINQVAVKDDKIVIAAGILAAFSKKL